MKNLLEYESFGNLFKTVLIWSLNKRLACELYKEWWTVEEII